MKKYLKILGLVLLGIVVYLYFTLYPKFVLVSGFSAKSVASHYFLAGRSQQFTEKTDNDIKSMDLASTKLDKTNKTVSSSVFWLKKRTAMYSNGLGAILLPEGKTTLPKTLLKPNRNKTSKALPFPYGNLPQKDTVFGNIDYKILDQALTKAFTENTNIKKTRSILVIYKDHIVAEKYKNGFDKNSLFLGWSMAKSITSTVLGALEMKGVVNLDENNLFPEWQNDDRKKITLRNLLNMNSGLAWEENYTKICDVTEMLFEDADMSQKQKNKKLIGKPNESWNYSSGTSNLLSGFIRNKFKTQQNYLDFWYGEFIDKIGMHSMLIEPDYSGHYVGSSYAWATARDWAKFGLLYLHDGNWNGTQIINKSWVDFVKTPTNTSNGDYGGHFWVNQGLHFPDVPKTMYYADGYQGQFVFIFPTKNLVIVRTGLSGEKTHINELLKDVLKAF